METKSPEKMLIQGDKSETRPGVAGQWRGGAGEGGKGNEQEMHKPSNYFK